MWRTTPLDRSEVEGSLQEDAPRLCGWTSVLERVARLADGRLTDGIEIRTRRVDAG
jgi:hypothetical protein